MRDIFVSYNHKDQEWVKMRLLPKLEEHRFTTFVDFRDFETGAFGVQEMERAVTTTRRTLLVLSPEYLASEWCAFENMMAQTLDPAAVSRRLIPVLFRECDLPLRLRALHYRNLTKDDPREWELLLRDLI